MKKTLLFAAALFASVAASAQTVTSMDGATWLTGLGCADPGAGQVVPAATVIADNEVGTLKTGAEDTYKATSAVANDFSQVRFGAEAIMTLDGGIQGSNNPKDGSGGVPAATFTAPSTGAYFQYYAKKDGYLYVAHKGSSNKSYTVFEEGACIPYTFVMHMGPNATAELPEVFSYTLPSVTVEGIELYDTSKGEIAWPEVIYTGNPKSAVKKGGVSVIMFKVFAECNYIFNACGSKMTLGGIAYSEAPVDVTLVSDAGEVALLKADGSTGGGSTGGAAKADYEIFTETVDEAGVKHYTMPTAMADLQAATGLPVTSWGIGIAVPAGKTILATSEFEVYAPTGHEVNVFDQWGKMGDCPIEGLLNYINVGVNDGTNQWGDDAVILDIEALARQGQTVLEVNAKASGKLGANIIIGENNRSVGIYKVPTEEEMNTDNFGGFVTNIKCDYGAMEKGTAPIPALVADVEAGRQYWIISSRENANLYEFTFAAGATGIEGVTSNVEKKIVAVYNLNGVRVNAPVKGLNIVKYSDGSTVKVIK